MNAPYLQINPKRFQALIDEFSDFGKTPQGGLTRLAGSNEDKQARDCFVTHAHACGCHIRMDGIGNLFARYRGQEDTLPAVLIGSHGDSQPKGGRFDGSYGVLAGLEVLRVLHENRIHPRRSIECVYWTNEEGARFSPAMMGSAVFSGRLPLASALASTDLEGISLQEAMNRIGYLGKDDLSTLPIHAALELHIEQGPILENAGKTIGVVKGAMGQRWFEVRFKGLAAHAGTTPMNVRRDALQGFAEAVLAIRKIGEEESDRAPIGRATVGMAAISPNSRNVIPGEVWFPVEFRHPHELALTRMSENLKGTLAKIAQQFDLELSLTEKLKMPPLSFSASCQDLIREVAHTQGFETEDIITGAGHDACNIHTIAPTGMIFIPCVAGLSHNEAEDITPAWRDAGANVLLQSLLLLANQ